MVNTEFNQGTPRKPNPNRAWLRRMLGCVILQLCWPIITFCKALSVLWITDVSTYVALSFFFALGTIATALTWCVMAWRPNFAQKLAWGVFVLALAPGVEGLLAVTGLLPAGLFRISTVTIPILSVLGPVYLAVIFRKYDFRFPVWPLVLLGLSHPLFMLLKVIELPVIGLGYERMLAGALPMLLGLVAWATVLVCLKKARPSHRHILMTG